ncbi:helix-turn-helix domain-containing protein [Nocardiopsis sp. CC223A]|uniref:helix-turn-helix domain-containing protein n=1 Tax=Nocardiopsis sp. CC223A TaxID=3044051 RepID=UPI00278C4D26|nr:helix-turn-helix domain-containing protein [Nocardiopsis sp. CC223A]
MNLSVLERRIRPEVVGHTLVGTTAPPLTDSAPGYDEVTGAVHRLLADSPSPMSVMEIAYRLGMPRAAVATSITALVRRRGGPLVQLSPAEPSPGFLRQAVSALTGDRTCHPVAGLASAKVLVTGPPRSGVSTLVGTAAGHPPVRLLEEIPDRGGQLRSYCLEQGAVEVAPTGRLHLLAAPPPALFDVLWVDMTRGASALLILVHSYRPWEAVPVLNAARDTRLPYVVVVNHVEGDHPDPRAVSERLGVDPDLLHITDVRSRTAARSVLARVLRRVEARRHTSDRSPVGRH